MDSFELTKDIDYGELTLMQRAIIEGIIVVSTPTGSRVYAPHAVREDSDIDLLLPLELYKSEFLNSGIPYTLTGSDPENDQGITLYINTKPKLNFIALYPEILDAWKETTLLLQNIAHSRVMSDKHTRVQLFRTIRDQILQMEGI